MKKINHILLGIIALLGFAPLTFAQGQYSIAKQIGALTYKEDDPYTTGNYTIEKNVGFSKVISEPQSDGTYWIKLEAFATGSSVVSAEPADIVLVLDYSGSMDTDYPVDPKNDIYFRARTRGNYSYQSFGTNIYYYKFEGKYYRVSRGGNAQGTGRYLTFTADDGTQYYLNNYSSGNQYNPRFDDTEGISTTPPTQPQSNNIPCWQGVLYETTTTRLDALKDAVEDFIEVIYHNDNYEDDTFDHPRSQPLGNRISVVAFSANQSNDNGAHILALNQSLMMSNQRSGWYNVTNTSGGQDMTLVNAVNSEGTHYGTYSNLGMTLANTLFSRIDASDSERKENSSRTVVLFTDGVPGMASDWTDNNCLPTAAACIREAHTAKNTYGATVFTVSVWDGDYSTTGGQQMLKYLNYTSSNYPSANPTGNAFNNIGVRCDDESIPEENRKDPIFQKDAGDDLSAVFVEIAKQSGGDSNLSQSSSAVDIVSSSFVVEKTEDKQVLVFTAKCATANPDNNHYTFLEETLIDHSTYTYNTYDDEGNVLEEDLDVDANIRVVPDDSDPNKITVVGFDYSNNWCGPKTDAAGNTEIMGHKIIIMIPVKMNPDAVGGPNVATNLPGSGIYANETHAADEKPIIEFDIPRVSLPVNIYVEKAGLRPGESAKFRIDRAKLPTGEQGTDWNVEDIAEKDWHYVSTIFVTNSPNSKVSDKTGNPMTKVRGMPANGYNWDEDGNYTTEKVNYIYRIVEEEWSWSYTPLTGPQYTVTDNVDNPFTFENQLRDNIDITVRHAESKVSNHFRPKTEGSTVGDVKTDDSKKNNRNSGSTSGASEEGATE